VPPLQIRERGVAIETEIEECCLAGSRGAARSPTFLSACNARSEGHQAASECPQCLSEPGSRSSGAYIQAFQRSADSDAPYLLERSAGAADFSCSTPEDTGERDGRLTGRPQARTGARTVLDSMGAPSLAVNADMAAVLGFHADFECLAESAESPCPSKGRKKTHGPKDRACECSITVAHSTMSAAMEALRARQIARRAARSPPSIAKIAAPRCAHAPASVLPSVSPARGCRLDAARIATLTAAQSRRGVACRSSAATADDGVVDIDADVVDNRVPITVRTRSFVGSSVPTRPPFRPQMMHLHDKQMHGCGAAQATPTMLPYVDSAPAVAMPDAVQLLVPLAGHHGVPRLGQDDPAQQHPDAGPRAAHSRHRERGASLNSTCRSSIIRGSRHTVCKTQ